MNGWMNERGKEGKEMQVACRFFLGSCGSERWNDLMRCDFLM